MRGENREEKNKKLRVEIVGDVGVVAPVVIPLDIGKERYTVLIDGEEIRSLTPYQIGILKGLIIRKARGFKNKQEAKQKIREIVREILDSGTLVV